MFNYEQHIVKSGERVIDKTVDVNGSEIRIIVYNNNGIYHITTVNLTDKTLYSVETEDKKYSIIDNIIYDIVLMKNEKLINEGFSIAF